MQNPLKPIGKRLLETEKEVQKKHVMDIVRNEALALRLEPLEKDVEFIENAANEINQRMMRLNKLITIAGWAWGRAADDEYMDKQFTLWNTIMGQWRDYYALIKPRESHEAKEYAPTIYVLSVGGQEFEVEDDITPNLGTLLSPEELRYLVVGSGERDFIVAGMTILHRTFKKEDVAGMYIAFYQGMQQQQGVRDFQATATMGEGLPTPGTEAMPRTSTA